MAGKQRATRYARGHDFNYPKFGKKIRAFTPHNDVFRRASRGEDSAKLLYRALNAKGGKRHHLFHKLKLGQVGGRGTHEHLPITNVKVDPMQRLAKKMVG